MPKKLTALALVAGMSVTSLVAAERTARADADQPVRNAASDATRAAERTAGNDGIAWGECADQDAGDAGIRCGDVSVPADWHRPRGKRTAIGLAKIPAENPEQRIGSLLINLGGPGSTIQGLAGHKDELAELTQWFDVIAFDPRGIGASSGVTCPRSPSKVKMVLRTDREAWRQLVRDNREWEDACRKASGALSGNLSAWQVAHDMEAIREALGEGKLNYYGNSYGTVYGQTYAELFPTRVRRMFLDSVANHTARSPLDITAPMAKAAAEEFRQFGQWCETDTDCALYPRNARQVWDELMARARRQPLPAPGAGEGKTVGPDRLRLATLNPISNRPRWPEFAEALEKARSGNASDLYIPIPPSSDTSVSNLAWCSDFPFRKAWGAMTALESRLRVIAPRIGWLMGRTQYGRCAGLRHQGTFPPHPDRVDDPDGLPPVLLVSGLRDLATPVAAGRTVAEQLPGSVWVGAKADHAVYLGGNECVRDIVHRYLTSGDLPEAGTVCPASGGGDRRKAATLGSPGVG